MPRLKYIEYYDLDTHRDEIERQDDAWDATLTKAAIAAGVDRFHDADELTEGVEIPRDRSRLRPYLRLLASEAHLGPSL